MFSFKDLSSLVLIREYAARVSNDVSVKMERAEELKLRAKITMLDRFLLNEILQLEINENSKQTEQSATELPSTLAR